VPRQSAGERSEHQLQERQERAQQQQRLDYYYHRYRNLPMLVRARSPPLNLPNGTKISSYWFGQYNSL
jgi:hypothetical protein